MAMNRREFVGFIALMACANSPHAQALKAMTNYYDLNAPLIGDDFVALDDISLYGTATRSTRVMFALDSGAHQFELALNAFGGCVRWLALPTQMIIGADHSLRWRLRSPDCAAPLEVVNGFLSYIDGEGMRHYHKIESVEGRL